MKSLLTLVFNVVSDHIFNGFQHSSHKLHHGRDDVLVVWKCHDKHFNVPKMLLQVVDAT